MASIAYSRVGMISSLLFALSAAAAACSQDNAEPADGESSAGAPSAELPSGGPGGSGAPSGPAPGGVADAGATSESTGGTRPPLSSTSKERHHLAVDFRLFSLAPLILTEAATCR